MTRFCLVAALVLPSAALAQGNPGPFGQFFGRSPAASAAEERSTVEVRSSLGGFYDSALFPPEGSPDTTPQTGFGAGATAGITLNHTSERFTASANGGATRFQYFEPGYGLNQFGGSASVHSEITTKVRADAAATYAHSPFFSVYQSFGRNTVADPNSQGVSFAPYAAQALENEMFDASAGIGVSLPGNSSLIASATRRQTMFANSDADFVMNGYRVGWSWLIGRGLGVRAGYGRERSYQYGDQAQTFDNELIDAGVDFTRAFSVARRTTFGFWTSTSIVKTSTLPREFRVNGGVSLSKFFRRTWQASIYATRDTSYVPGFYEPLFSSSAGLSVGGMLSSRVEWMTYATASIGESAFSNTSGFNTISASSRLTLALTKNLGFFGEYVAYQYEVPNNSNVLGLNQNLARQVVAIGINAYLPVYNKRGSK